MGDIDESERELERLRATLLRARAIPVAKKDLREPKGGQKLGDDIYGRQPQPDEQNTTWLAAADFAYPKPLVPSAKITVIKQLMLNFRKNHPEDKIIIFSQFLETHQIIGRMLQAEGIPFAYFWGGQTADQKNTVIRDFHEKSDFKVLVREFVLSFCGIQSLMPSQGCISQIRWYWTQHYVRQPSHHHRAGLECSDRAASTRKEFPHGTNEDYTLHHSHSQQHHRRENTKSQPRQAHER